MKRLMVVLGFGFTLLGVVGAFLPVLPATPFLLAASYCFVRSSDRINRRFVATRFYQEHVEPFARERALTLSAKIRILSLAAVMLATAFFLVENFVARAGIVIVMAAKLYCFLFLIKTKRPEAETAAGG